MQPIVAHLTNKLGGATYPQLAKMAVSNHKEILEWISK